jgi:hypothetical protein
MGAPLLIIVVRDLAIETPYEFKNIEWMNIPIEAKKCYCILLLLKEN